MTDKIATVSDFWNLFERELAISVAKAPEDYALRPGAETPESYAHSVRLKFHASAEISGLNLINIGSPTFKRCARACGIVKFSQRALKDFYDTLRRS